MRCLWAALFALMISKPILAGGMSGGTGIGGLILDMSLGIQRIIKLPKIHIDQQTWRRIIMRLAVFGVAEIHWGDKTIIIKCKYGRVVDLSESFEILVEPDPTPSAEPAAQVGS